MPTYLEIAVNVPQVAGVFHYHIPPELEGNAGPGHLVRVPFGKQIVQGVVLREVSQPSVAETRAVLDLVDPLPVFTQAQIHLAEKLAQETLAPLADMIGMMLPPGLSQKAETEYSLLTIPDGVDAGPVNETQRRVQALLARRGPLRTSQLAMAFPKSEWRPAARGLLRRGLVSARSILSPPTVQPKYVRTAQLACPPKEAEAALPKLGRAGTAALERRQAMLRFLLREPGPVNVSWVYAESGGQLADLRMLAEGGLVILSETEIWRDPLDKLDFQPTQAPPLTRDQQAVWSEVEKCIGEAARGGKVAPMLLHGVTGSGKTEVYLKAVAETLRLGRQAIVLVPEIALTPQTVRRFVSRFPGRVGLMHSRLSPGERYDTWRRARLGKLDVIVGPRSALFTAFQRLGLIVVDECHDDSYYQQDAPHYHAVRAAAQYAGLAGAVCLLGSATPDITSTYLASQRQWRYLYLPARILAHREAVQAQAERLQATSRYRPLEALAEMADLPPVKLVDMRQELRQGNRSIFSRDLIEALEMTLSRGQQAILFLNRRGAATYVFCRECGHTLKCPRCDLPLTFHQAREGIAIEEADGEETPGRQDLLCHHCGYRRKQPEKCPECGSRQIRQFGTGTERVEEEVLRLFPKARTLRWDADSTRQKGAHEVILSHFSAHRADVLVGTQMLAKGLDLPLVTLVGAVLADVGLSLPDYRAAERTFQVLTQVAGRAGRSLLGGQVVLQTFQPEHYAIQAASRHDYRAFYHQELAFRRELGYPPFAQVVRLEYRHADAYQAEQAAGAMAAQLRGWLEAGERRATYMAGPAPCFFARLGGMHRWQIVLRGPDPASLLRGRILGEWRVEVNPTSLL